MDVIPELLPPVNKVKLAQTAKDSPEHKQHPKQLAQHVDEHLLDDDSNIVAFNVENQQDVERRSGDDRRQHRLNRGRWLESRERNDRRAQATSLFVKI